MPFRSVRAALRSLHRRSRGSALLHRLAVGSRVLLCAGFLPTGVVKLLGRPFTRMGPETPVGLFFHAMHQTGVYWQFLGAMQVLAAVLIVIPATTHLGALLFLPIIVNIAMITIGVGFGGTVFITVPMCFAALLLVCWEYDRWESILFRPDPGGTGEPAYAAPPPRVPLSKAETLCYGAGLAFGLFAFTGFRLFTGPRSTWIALGLAFLAAVAAVALGLTAAWRGRPTRSSRSPARSRSPGGGTPRPNPARERGTTHGPPPEERKAVGFGSSRSSPASAPTALTPPPATPSRPG